ncbi:hypothetical protein [Stieleria sedimenti]|uniref:hypothetical protein n=1 Tax=Stieleria sedimenti TaxID=2976331 RepID=UPI00218097A1|nr:hypothetical protein [Stieleria sedimenti]
MIVWKRLFTPNSRRRQRRGGLSGILGRERNQRLLLNDSDIAAVAFQAATEVLMANPSDTPTGDALHSGIKSNCRIVHGRSLAMGWIFRMHLCFRAVLFPPEGKRHAHFVKTK